MNELTLDVVISDYPFPGFLAPIEERAREFERRHPEYRVALRGHPYQEVPAEVSERALSGRPPALVTYHSGALRQARDTITADGEPLFTSIERAVGGRREILGEPVVLDDLLPALRDYFTYAGDLTSVPLTASTMVLYANTALLRAAGIAEVPRTWDQVECACARLAGPGITWPNDGKLFLHWASQQGGELTDRENGRAGLATTVDLTGKPLMSFVDWWQRLHTSGGFSYHGIRKDVAGSEAGAWAGPITAFAKQRVAMRVGSSFEAGYVSRAGFEVAVRPLPHRDDVPPAGNWIGGDSFWLTGGLDPAIRDGALAFVQYLSAPGNVAAWHRASGSIPTTHAAVELLTGEGWYDQHPEHAAALAQIGLTGRTPGSCSPIIPGWHTVQPALERAMDDVLTTGADPAGRFAAANVEAQRALEEYRAECTAGSPRGTGWLRAGT